MNTYEITISPDPLLWVKKNGRVFQELLYAERAKIIQNEIVDYMKSQLYDFFIELHYERSPKNGNFHCHGIIKTKLVIKQTEFIDIIGARLQRRTVKNRLAAVRIGQQDGTQERSKYWLEYIGKENIIPPYLKYYKYTNKWSSSMHNIIDADLVKAEKRYNDQLKKARERTQWLSRLLELSKVYDDLHHDNDDLDKTI